MATAPRFFYQHKAIMSLVPRSSAKLPIDYVLKHQIRITYKSHETICASIERHMQSLHGSTYRIQRHANRAAKKLSDLFDMWLTPINATAIMYQDGLKEKVMETFQAWSDDDDMNGLYAQLYDGGATLKAKAAKGFARMRAIVFRRHIEI
jgi:hypothetical protein